MSGHNSTEITKNSAHSDNLAHNGSQASSRKPGILAHQRQLSPTIILDKMKIIYRPMSILVRRDQEKYFLG